jgi:outer membrane protein TolC
VTTAVKEASLRERIRTTGEIIASQTKQLDLVERKFQLGGISRSDVLAQKTQLAQTKASLPPLENEMARTRHQLAALLGGFPDERGVRFPPMSRQKIVKVKLVFISLISNKKIGYQIACQAAICVISQLHLLGG